MPNKRNKKGKGKGRSKTTSKKSQKKQPEERRNEYLVAGLQSPPRGATNADDAKQKMEKDGIYKRFGSRSGKDSEEFAGLLYLYDRDFLLKYTTEARVDEIENILSKEPTYEKSPHSRFMKLISSNCDKNLSENKESVYMLQFMERLKNLYLVQKGSVQGFLRNDKIVMYLRTQSCGNCYLIGAVIFVCLVAQFLGHDMEPLDVSKYIRHSYEDDELIRLIVKDSGGDPEGKVRQILEKLTGASVRPLKFFWIDGLVDKGTVHLLADALEEHGPGLVSEFTTVPAFGKTDPVRDQTGIGLMQYDGSKKKSTKLRSLKGRFKLFETIDEAKKAGVFGSAEIKQARKAASGLNKSYDDASVSDEDIATDEESDYQETKYQQENAKGSKEPKQPGGNAKAKKVPTQHGKHAMVLLHARKDDTGKYWFLLQNWWPNSLLVEVSDTYLSECGAMIYFLEQAVVFKEDLKNVYSKNKARIAHCNNLDRSSDREITYKVGTQYGCSNHVREKIWQGSYLDKEGGGERMK